MREGVGGRTPSVPGKKVRGRFLHEVITELQKVKWPTREDVVQLTGVVIASVVIVGIYVASLDYVFSRLFQFIGMYGGK